MKILLSTLLALAASLPIGCAATSAEQPLTASDPASAGAAESAMPPRSQTLAMPSDASAAVSSDRPHSAHEPPARAQEAAATTEPGENAALSAPRFTPATAPANGATIYVCPMHKDVTSDRPGKCPKCGMKLVAKAAPAASRDHSQHGGQP